MGESSRKKPWSDEPTEKDLELILSVAKSTARARGANRMEADEVAQAVAVKLWTKWRLPSVQRARAKSDDSWAAYIRTTARNLHVDLIRGHQRRIARQTRASTIHDGNTVTSSNGWQVPATPAVAEGLIARWTIAGEIRALPPKQRAVAEGIFIRELTVSELAAEMNVQTQLVRKHLRKAKQALQDRLAEAERQAL